MSVRGCLVGAVLLLIIASASRAQLYDGGLGYMGEGGVFVGGIGVTAIDDETYFTFNFRPEISIGKIGVGLSFALLYNTETGHIRSKDWDSSYDYFRLIRYARYGRKYDPFYTRVGCLDAARLGHGFIVNYYSNDVHYDERKIGLVFDLDFGSFGFESMANNLGRAEIIGGRGYWRPLRMVTPIPIIKNLAFGATYVTDIDPDSHRDTDDGVSVFGLDVELPIIQTKILRSMLYADFAQIVDYGSGQAAGISGDLGNLLGLIDLHAKFERRWLGTEFLPTYLGPFYEIERAQMDMFTTNPEITSKEDSLRFISDKTKGYFGEVWAELLKTVRIIGMFQRLDDKQNSGILHFGAEAPELPVVAARASYDKIGIEKLNDIFTLDSRSVARAGIGYKIKPYLIFYCDYIWTLVWDADLSKYKPQERIQPSISFVWHFM